MTDENNNPPKRIFKQTFQGQFGVSDNPADHGFGRHPEVTDPDAQETRSERREFERSQERKFGDRKDKRSFGRDRKPFGDRGERRSFGDRDGKRSFGERRERKPFDCDENRSFGDRSERRSFGDRGERRSFGDRDGKRSFGERRERRPFDRGDRKPFNRAERRGRFQDDERSQPIFRQKPESKRIEDEEIVRDEDAVLQYADSEEISAENAGANPPWFRKLLALTTEKGRAREEKFLAEGVRVVDEIITNHQDVLLGIYAAGTRKLDENGAPVLDEKGEEIFVEANTLSPLLDKARKQNLNVRVIAEDQIRRLSSTVTTQGVIAVCRMASSKPNYEKSRSILTIVDAIQDPGNLGAIFRTSLGFESAGIVIGKGSVNPFNPKVVRGSSGTFLRVPFERDVDLIDMINELHRYGYTIIATDLHGKQSLAEIEPRKLRKVAFLVGNEGAGTDRRLIDISDETVRIPMSSELESLNVAVAHGILSYEMANIQKDLQ